MGETEKTKMEESQNNPCWVAFIHPLTFVVPDDEIPWEVKLEEINNVSYSHGNLIRIVAKFPIEKCELDGLICYDGAIAIPMNKSFPTKEDAVNFFSRFLTKLLLADFYAEGIDQRDVVTGNLSDKWAIWPTNFGDSSISNLHSKLRMRTVTNTDAIYLLGPRKIHVEELLQKLNIGEKVLADIPNLNPKFLLRGITEYKYKNWDLVLSNLWITVEQLIDYLWNKEFLKNTNFHPNSEIPLRKKSMTSDNRTWSATIKQEILFQNKIISEQMLSHLFQARKVRNSLVHDGKSVDENIARNILETTLNLIKQISKNCSLNPGRLDEKDFPGFRRITPSFKSWKNLPEKDFIEEVFGYEYTKKIKK
jgi:hypothetical protein